MDDPSQKRPYNAAPLIGSPLSDPGIPSLSTSPTSFFIERTQSLNALQQQQPETGSDLDRSYSNMSEIEVILDDGSTQKRTVSLSTLPDEESNTHTHKTANDDDDDTTPLLKSHKGSYQSINKHYSSSSSSSSSSDDDGSDSDEPFFPIQKQSTKKKPYHVVEDDETGLSGFWTRCQHITSNLIAACNLSPRQRLVLKCSFAYFLGSLFTFIPALNALIGYNHTSSHLVATATVFFNPAKTLGGMVEAAAYGWGYVLFAVTVCLGSMITTDFFVDRNYYLIAHLISLLFWLSGATFIVAFLKAHWNKPPVATASSLCFIIIFIIVVREGSVNKGDFDTTRIEQITTAVATGTLITVACCIIFWPVSASKQLKKDLDDTLSSYRVLLKLLTKTFLLDDDLPEFKANRVLQSAIQSHQASFTSLQKSLKEAKLESFWNREVRGCSKEYDAVVKSMQRLAQHMGGLRSSCGIQFEMMGSEATQKYKEMSRQRKKNKLKKNMTSFVKSSATFFSTSQTIPNNSGINASSNKSKFSQSFVPTSTIDDANWNVRAGYRRRKLQDEMRRQKTFYEDDRLDAFLKQREATTSKKASYADVTARGTTHEQAKKEEDEASLIKFIQNIRPPLKSFVYTCKRTLYHLQTNFSTKNPYNTWLPRSTHARKTPSLHVLRDNLEKAIHLFESAQQQAIQKMYSSRVEYVKKHLDQTSNNAVDIESEAIDSILGEEVILVYFFVYNMLEFARELITLTQSVERLNNVKEKRLGLFTWLYTSMKEKWQHRNDETQNRHLHIVPFVPNERNMKNTLHTPLPKTKWRRFFIRVWSTLSLFKLQKIRYATKAMVATIILATPAFLSTTQDMFREYRMEWALITLMVVMTPTVGGTNLVAIYRIFSTILGCYIAMAFYMLFPGNWHVLCILTWLFSIPNFYLILYHKHGKFGQFTLLAYNLVMLNKYNDRATNAVPVWLLATQRCIAILVGVVFGLFVTAYIWPFEARVELRKGLSDFLLRLSWLYEKLVSIYADYPVNKKRPVLVMETGPDPSETQTLTFETQLHVATQSFMDLELGLQRSLLDLQALLSQTPNEPRLKGPFPVDTYRSMLTSCQNIVDRFLSMRTVILKDTWYDEVQHGFMTALAQERKEMVGNVILYFYLLASALRLKTPMPPYFPPARKAWKSLLEKLCDMPLAKSKQLIEKDNIYVFYYAYVTLMEDIIRELDKLGDSMTKLFGSLVPEEQWESLFDQEGQQPRAYI